MFPLRCRMHAARGQRRRSQAQPDDSLHGFTSHGRDVCAMNGDLSNFSPEINLAKPILIIGTDDFIWASRFRRIERNVSKLRHREPLHAGP